MSAALFKLAGEAALKAALEQPELIEAHRRADDAAMLVTVSVDLADESYVSEATLVPRLDLLEVAKTRKPSKSTSAVVAKLSRRPALNEVVALVVVAGGDAEAIFTASAFPPAKGGLS